MDWLDPAMEACSPQARSCGRESPIRGAGRLGGVAIKPARRAGESGSYFTPFLDRRVPLVIPWRDLNFGLDLQITYSVPLRRTTWQSAWRRFIEEREERTFIGRSGLVRCAEGQEA